MNANKSSRWNNSNAIPAFRKRPSSQVRSRSSCRVSCKTCAVHKEKFQVLRQYQYCFSCRCSSSQNVFLVLRAEAYLDMQVNEVGKMEISSALPGCNFFPGALRRQLSARPLLTSVSLIIAGRKLFLFNSTADPSILHSFYWVSALKGGFNLPHRMYCEDVELDAT